MLCEFMSDAGLDRVSMIASGFDARLSLIFLSSSCLCVFVVNNPGWESRKSRLTRGERIDESLRFVLSRPFLSGFTIGFGSDMQIDDIIRRIDAIHTTA